MTLRGHLTASIALSLVGLAIGAYLVWAHYNIDALVCGTGGCEVVQTSSYATVLGVPIAWFGAAMYLTMLALGVLRRLRPDLLVPLTAAALATTGAGTLYSLWLTWIEIFEIEAICQWCVASAVVTTLLFANEVPIFRHLWSADEIDEEDDIID